MTFLFVMRCAVCSAARAYGALRQPDLAQHCDMQVCSALCCDASYESRKETFMHLQLLEHLCATW